MAGWHVAGCGLHYMEPTGAQPPALLQLPDLWQRAHRGCDDIFELHVLDVPQRRKELGRRCHVLAAALHLERERLAVVGRARAVLGAPPSVARREESGLGHRVSPQSAVLEVDLGEVPASGGRAWAGCEVWEGCARRSLGRGAERQAVRRTRRGRATRSR